MGWSNFDVYLGNASSSCSIQSPRLIRGNVLASGEVLEVVSIDERVEEAARTGNWFIGTLTEHSANGGKREVDRDLAGKDLSGADFAEANLTGADLTGADLSHIIGADLSGAILE